MNLLELLETPPAGLVNRTIHNDDLARIILFSFAAGHEMAAHSAPGPSFLQILKGTATVTLGTEKHEVAEGFLAAMPAKLVHAIHAKTPLLLMLTMLKTTATSG